MNIHTPEKLHSEIVSAVSSGVSYIDALVEYSERSGVSVEIIAEIIKRSPTLFELVKEESLRLKLYIPSEEELSMVGVDSFFE